MLWKSQAPSWAAGLSVVAGTVGGFSASAPVPSYREGEAGVGGSDHVTLCLDGHVQCRVALDGGRGDVFKDVDEGTLHYHPADGQCQICLNGRRRRMLELAISVSDFLRLVGDTPLGRRLGDEVLSGQARHVPLPVSPPVRQALADLGAVLARADGGPAPLVLAKCLEILWILTSPRVLPASGSLPAVTLRAIDTARSILQRKMADPPCLAELAAEVGMSLSKFKRVFHLACGMPPYTYLRRVRMEYADHLLRCEGLSVTETAFEVGYSNLSHFSKAFADHFGVMPSQARSEF